MSVLTLPFTLVWAFLGQVLPTGQITFWLAVTGSDLLGPQTAATLSGAVSFLATIP